MHLIAPLVTGINGAESGHAEIYNRGTSTPATYYSTFEGAVHGTSAANLTLDSFGGAEAYVNNLVDVVVKSTSGTTVRSFTAGDASGNTEVRSAAFTGTHYDTAASAVSNPTTLQAVLDLWKTNAGNHVSGSIDWKVRAGGISKTLAAWMGVIGGNPVYNVKDPTYAATGDGTTDDLAAINLATAAAASAGGIVYFPPGTYSVSGAVAIPAKVSMLGAGMESTTIQVDHASAKCFTTAATTYGTYIGGFRLTAGEPNSGTVVEFLGACEIIMEQCYIGGTDNNATQLVDSAAAAQHVTVRDCVFQPGADAVDSIDCDLHTSGRWKIEGCRFILPSTHNATNAVIYGNLMDVRDCVFETGSVTTGTLAVISIDNTVNDATVTGCKFATSGGATVTCITLGTYTAAARFIEADNDFPLYTDANTTAYSYTLAVSGAQVQLKSREHRVQITAQTGAFVPETDQYGVIILTTTGTGSVSMSATNGAPEGAPGMVVAYKASDGAQSVGPDDEATSVPGFKFGAGLVSMIAGQAGVWHYVAGYVNSTVCLFVSLSGDPDIAGLP